MVVFENETKNFRLISSITDTKHFKFNLYNFGLSYCKRTKFTDGDYTKALTLDLIFIHFVIEWIPDNTSENLNEPK